MPTLTAAPLAPHSAPAARRFAVVSTCHAAGYVAYGERMVDSWLAHWPAAVRLMLYHEGFEPAPVPGRIEALDLIACCPRLAAFKARHADNPLAHGQLRPWRSWKLAPFLTRWLPMRRLSSYRWDAVRFAHKSYAIFDAARRCDADVLIWVDADTLFFADVSPQELQMLAPPDSAVSCLRRPRHSECGFVVYNLRHPETRRLLSDFEAMYEFDLLFGEREFHDSHLFDVVCKRAEGRGARIHDIAEGGGAKAQHVLINSRLGRYMDHLKGGRKNEGRSRADDLVVARTEAYWQQPPV